MATAWESLETLVFTQIYRYSIFLFVYKCIKAVIGAILGTSELYRIADSAVTNELKLALHNQTSSYNKNNAALLDASLKSIINPTLLIRIETCILYSKQLGEFRLRLEEPRLYPNIDTYFPLLCLAQKRGFYAWKRTIEIEQEIDDDKEEVIKKEIAYGGYLSRWFGYMRIAKKPLGPAALVLRESLKHIQSLQIVIHGLNARSSTRYDSNQAPHEKKLLAIWSLLQPDEPLLERYTSQWQAIGFQGKDPSSDFRAMGLLALDDLHYIASNYNTLAKGLVATFPFFMAIVSINLTAYTLRLVRARQLNLFFYKHGITKETYHEIFCACFSGLGKYWSGQKKAPTILEFNKIFKEFQIAFEEDLTESKVELLSVAAKKSE